VLRERVEAHQRQQHSLEKKLMNQELEKQEQVWGQLLPGEKSSSERVSGGLHDSSETCESSITRIRQECELKIQGLMPAELQQELEDTITSLKAQVTFLQKRASLLQEQLDTPRHRSIFREHGCFPLVKQGAQEKPPHLLVFYSDVMMSSTMMLVTCGKLF
ncbi:hypothetical protein DNTS_024678, partial [Danionella cerebrum]